MGSCLAVEVRDQPTPYYDRSGQPRHVMVRQKNKSAYRTSDESSLYRPRSRLTIRHDDYRSQEDFRNFDNRQNNYVDQFAPRAQTDYRNDRPFQPLPPQVPRTPLIHNEPFRNNNPHDLGMLDYGPPPNHHNEVQVIDDNPVEIIPRSPRSDRGRRQVAGHSSRRGGGERKYYDDSDDDSWAEKSPRTRYSDDPRIEVHRPVSHRSSQRRSRSRNNGQYYR